MSSRSLRTGKRIVYGKPSTPKVSKENFDDNDLKSPITAASESLRKKKSIRTNKSAQIPQAPRIGPRSTDYRSEADVEERASSRHSAEHTDAEDDSAPSSSEKNGVDHESTFTPTRKKRRKYKGWAYVEETGDVAQDGVQKDVVGLDNGVGRLKRGRNDLTIDMKPKQLQPRRSSRPINGTYTDSPGQIAGRARRTPRIVKGREDVLDRAEGKVRPASRRNRDRQSRETNGFPPVTADKREGKAFQESVKGDLLVDELAYASQERERGSKKEPGTQSHDRRQKKKAQGIRESSSPFSRHRQVQSPSTATREDILDSPTCHSDHAQTLQAMLENCTKGLETIRAHLLSGLTGRRHLPLINLEDEHQKVKQLVEQTVLAGEGNSMLIIGARGSGKTLLVETVISDLSSNHREHFHVVRLNGFIHTDDKLALREIWRQLGREMEVEDDELGARSNYADTLSSLLALLAHPTTEDTAEEDGAGTARSVVFVLDEFNLFASHPRQTLLYNLFDVAQSRNAPIAVLGLTTKVNVVDILEKRVKSRFGQRYVHLSLPRTFAAFQTICLSALQYRPSTQDLLYYDKSNGLHEISAAWNAYISSLLSTPPLQHLLHTIYTTTKSIPAFLSASLIPISSLSPTTLPTPASFTSSPLLPPDSKLHLLPSLSTLALSLLIAAARLDIILSTDICTFSVVYDEYVALASKSRMQSSAAGQMAVGGVGGARVWGRELAKGAWEQLAELEFVLPAVGVAGGGGGRGGGGAGKGEMWRVDVGLEEIGGVLEMEGGKGGVLGKWCREI